MKYQNQKYLELRGKYAHIIALAGAESWKVDISWQSSYQTWPENISVQF